MRHFDPLFKSMDSRPRQEKIRDATFLQQPLKRSLPAYLAHCLVHSCAWQSPVCRWQWQKGAMPSTTRRQLPKQVADQGFWQWTTRKHIFS